LAVVHQTQDECFRIVPVVINNLRRIAWEN
jgi:hypothetical protein